MYFELFLVFDFENITSLCGPVYFKLPQNDREHCKMIYF